MLPIFFKEKTVTLKTSRALTPTLTMNTTSLLLTPPCRRSRCGLRLSDARSIFGRRRVHAEATTHFPLSLLSTSPASATRHPVLSSVFWSCSAPFRWHFIILITSFVFPPTIGSLDSGPAFTDPTPWSRILDISMFPGVSLWFKTLF